MLIGGPDTIFLLIFRPYTLGDFLKIKYQKSAQKITTAWRLGGAENTLTWRFTPKKSSLCGDWGSGRDFLLIFRPYTLGDLLKIKYKKTHTKSSMRGDWGSGHDLFAYF